MATNVTNVGFIQKRYKLLLFEVDIETTYHAMSRVIEAEINKKT